MKKYIFCNYFRSKDLIRNSENIFCIQKNLNLSFINKIFVFCDFRIKKDLIKLKNNKKIIYINTYNKILNLRELFDSIKNNHIDKEAIIIILNLDIYLENSAYWKYIDKNFFSIGEKKKTLVCIRSNINEKNYTKNRLKLEKLSRNIGDFSDCWVFKTPIDKNFLNENLNFPLWGSRAADVLLMGLMCKHFHTYSWGSRYKINHLHTIESVDNHKNIKDYWRHEILKKQLNISCLIRIHEAARIPPSQDFKYLLKSGIRPRYCRIKKNQNIFKIYLRIIYFIMLKFRFFLEKKLIY